MVNLLGVISCSMRYAKRQGWIQTNPAEDIDLPSQRESTLLPSKQRDAIPREVIRKILERFPEGHSSHLPIMLAYHCGLRKGEVFGLSWDIRRHGMPSDGHSLYVKKGVHVEIHNRVSRFPDNEKGCYTRRYFADAEQRVIHQDAGKGIFPMLAHPYQSISLLAHMERHMCASGIGLRQLCDGAVMIHCMSEAEEDELLTVLEACGMIKFA